MSLHPLAAAAVLRNHGLASSFLAVTSDVANTQATVHPASPKASAYSSGGGLPKELLPEDSSQARILGMQHHPLVGEDIPEWCKCERCRPVQNTKARICCRTTAGRCILLEDAELRFLVLGSRSVRTALNQARCLNFQETWNYNPANLRFQAYKQYIYATNGCTGRGNRVPIPACICWAVRDRWPSMSYTGFREAAVNGTAKKGNQEVDDDEEEDEEDDGDEDEKEEEFEFDE